MNILDAVLIDDAIKDAQTNEGLTKIRAKLNKSYDRIREENFSYDEPPEYQEIGEEGIPGFAVN